MLVRYRPLNGANLEHFQRRVESIPVTRRPRWGSMSAAQMFAHLRRSLELSLDQYPEPDRSTWATRLYRRIYFSPLAWPRGMKSPRYFFPEPGEDEKERRILIEAMHRFVREVAEKPERSVASPLFGPMTMLQWSNAHGRHFEHHLRQFEV